MTNTTTYFFREARALRGLIDALPPPRAHVWIVGCSTGDEVYSLSILAAEAGRSLDITASDINPIALNAASAGRYRGRNLRLLDARRIGHYFEPAGDDTFAIRRDRLPNITWRFVHHDIASDPPLAPLDAMSWDAVVCRHVLVYLDDAASLRALRTITGNLRDSGHLLLAGSEWLGHHTRDESLARRARMELTMLTHRDDEEPLLVYRWHKGSDREPTRFAPAPLATMPVRRSAPIAPSAPDSHWLACVSGDRALDSGDIERALAHYQLAEAIRPEAPEVQLRLGLAHMIAGDGQLARQALERLVAQRSSWPALLLLGDIAVSHNAEHAGDYYRRALRELESSSAIPAELGPLQAFWPDRATLLDMLSHKTGTLTHTPRTGE